MALSLGLPPPEVIRHRASKEPGLSSPPANYAGTGRAAIRPADIGNKGVARASVKMLFLFGYAGQAQSAVSAMARRSLRLAPLA